MHYEFVLLKSGLILLSKIEKKVNKIHFRIKFYRVVEWMYLKFRYCKWNERVNICKPAYFSFKDIKIGE